MTEKQEIMLKTFARINHFDFDTKLQIGDFVVTINELLLNDDPIMNSMIISEILKKRFTFYFDKEKIMNELKEKRKQQNRYWKNYLRQARIKKYKEQIDFYSAQEKIWNCVNGKYLTQNEINERIAKFKKLLYNEENIL